MDERHEEEKKLRKNRRPGTSIWPLCISLEGAPLIRGAPLLRGALLIRGGGFTQGRYFFFWKSEPTQIKIAHLTLVVSTR